jgi:chromosome segregation ATPase
LICAGLVIALVVNQNRSSTQHSTDSEIIDNYSNKWVKTSTSLDEQIQVNSLLTNDLGARLNDVIGLSNKLTDVSGNLSKAEESLKATQEEVAKRDAKISELEAQNQALDQRTADLSTSITNLTSQIEDTQKKLATSEGDKAFLEKELQRLMSEKAELERQFNDLTILRAQVSKLKEELNISRRLEWIRQGLFTRSEQKGAQQLMQKSTPATANVGATNVQPAKPIYDLNVEVSADGSVKVIPSTNSSPSEPAPK